MYVPPSINVCLSKIQWEENGDSKKDEAKERIIPLSKEEKKRLITQKREQKKESLILERMGETQYVIHEGMRFVKPYYHDHKLHAKERWYGNTLEHLFLNEFSVSQYYFDNAVKREDITVNGKKGEEARTHVLAASDLIHHRLHRHEPPVLNIPIKIVADTEDILAIDKPPSIPIHPSGSYRHNTILDILAREYGFTSRIYPLHRLDRLTSGLLLIGRKTDVAKKVGANMRTDAVEKQYLARVSGLFPSEPQISEELIGPWPGRRGLQRISPDGKTAHTTFTLLKHFPDNTSLVLCTLKTGRTHQIRVHLKGIGFPITNDPAYGPESPPFDFIPATTISSSVIMDDEDEEGDISSSSTSTFSYPPSPFSSESITDNSWKDEICDFCNGRRRLVGSQSPGIWLHAYRYTSPDWKFEVTMPEWAL